MGNGAGNLNRCFSGAGAGDLSRRHDIAVVLSDPLDVEGLGHSFCYIKPDANDTKTNKTTAFFRSISGASVSANASTPLSTSIAVDDTSPQGSASFESSTLFASIPLQPVPRFSFSNGVSGSVPMERGGFLSGPIERGFASGPIDHGSYSCPMDKLDMSFSTSNMGYEPSNHMKEKKNKEEKEEKRLIMKIFKRVILEKIIMFSCGNSKKNKSFVAPICKGVVVEEKNVKMNDVTNSGGGSSTSTTNLSSSYNGGDDEDDVDVDADDEDYSLKCQNLQWAQGKAGEDRVQLVISEENGWVFVGIYDGFNGPDAPDYLLANLYPAVHKELKGLLWIDKFESADLKRNSEGIESRVGGKKWEESQRRWKCEWNRERLELDRKLKENFNCPPPNGVENFNHSDVLKALSVALKKTEDAYLDAADKMVKENPELALMGSCVLVMLMKGEDVYLMNVGDSRAVLARKAAPDLGIGRERRDLDPINEETLQELELSNGDHDDNEFELSNLTSFQLTMDHSTYVEEEVERIKNEHPDDAYAVMNDRVKGYLKVTRAFGAGFLKQPKWNDALLEMFRIDYVGSWPYITCSPSLYHHKLSSRDRFLILSSDGLYQYFTNEEAVSEVELFIASFPEGDPAQHLIEQVLFRAARKAGMDFHELLDIPQGERRRYHDDISIIVISLEGRIWRSSV
ncbi:probable protein phosphatase 2C 4 isoform X2 [Morus notabilis]|uniref:probable protein phosphatase 2C 4 isoform X2 n=1 Tax=Morus notabilis TaxID=981085 RepID=UPI000CED395B|nr:probable protein phosphatase 2C 4 isoform X2 [Morus notabilis]